MILEKKIFRKYDIRGRAFVDFDAAGFFAIGKIFAQKIAVKFKKKNPAIFLSGDGRNSMLQLFPAIAAGLRAGGAKIIWGGAVPTPINFFVRHAENFDAAVQITASHNPADENGLKLTDRAGAFCGDEIAEIFPAAKKLKIEKILPPKNLPVRCFTENYFQKIKKISGKIPRKKILIDAGNAIAGKFYPEFLRKMGAEISELFCDFDPNFPNHAPDPEEKKNLRFLIEKMKTGNFDFGFAFDGDGDRLGIILQNGEILAADKILFILAADFLSRNPGEKIVVDAMSSEILISKIEKLGGKIILSATGHSFIEKNMQKFSAKFGGEQSGHFMFGENFFGHDDAFLAAVRFLLAVENRPDLIFEVQKNWSKSHEFSEKFFAADEKKFAILENFKKKIAQKFPPKKINFVDGARVKFENLEWGIVRCSNTSPKISVRIEAQNSENLEKYKKVFLSNLNLEN